MKITFLGTGTSQGIPVISCPCKVCHSSDLRDNRLRVSVLIETPEANIVIDSGPDFRYQMLRAQVQKLDAIIFTHSHKDHIAGLDDIRAFNYFQKKAIDVYASEETQQALKREFAYIFNNKHYPGIPKIELHNFANEPFFIKGIKIIPVRVTHFGLEVFGLRIGDFTYITDANAIAPDELDKARGSKFFVVNALRHEPHVSHFSLNEAVAIAQEIAAEKSFFTHISHQLGLHEEVEKTLPENIHLAYDGLTLEL